MPLTCTIVVLLLIRLFSHSFQESLSSPLDLNHRTTPVANRQRTPSIDNNHSFGQNSMPSREQHNGELPSHVQNQNPSTSIFQRIRSPLRFLTHGTSNGGTNDQEVDPNQLEAGLQNVSEKEILESKEVAEAPTTGNDIVEEHVPESEWRDTQSDDYSSSMYGTHHLETLDTQHKDEEKEEQKEDGALKSTRSRFWSAIPFKSSRHNESEDPQQDEETARKSESKTTQLPKYTEEAQNLIRTFTMGDQAPIYQQSRSGTETPAADKHISYESEYVPAPKQYKASIFGTILTSRLNELQNATKQPSDAPHRQSQPAEYLDLARRILPHDSKHHRGRSWEHSPSSSGMVTPKKMKWHDKPEQNSAVANMLVQAGLSTTGPGVPKGSEAAPRSKTPPLKAGNLISSAVDIIKNPAASSHGRKKNQRNRESDVVAEVADILACRKYLTKLCDAFMKNGAPTHRIEEYLASSARALCIDADFMYIPGAMMCTFIDHTLHTNSVELVRRREGVDLGRLKDVFNVYKCIIHSKYSAEEAILELDNIQSRPELYSTWFRIFIFGLASVVVGPFSFNSRPIDFAPIFILGCFLGFMQLKIIPRSEQFSNVFEVFACVLFAFIARGIGSIKSHGDYIFCFSGIAQSSIAMILPGFLVLNSALELQSRNIVAGSVRMVYAIIYVLFLGFGLLVGTTIFGLMKRDAVTDVTCSIPIWFSPADSHWKLIYTRFIWVPLFACCIAIMYRAKLRQLPVMALIAVCGYQANFWISTQLSSNLQVANAVGAFVVGCLANLYSRLFHGLAAASMLPAIYCQVPGGLAASGSLVAGVDSSNQIFGNSSSISIINNGTEGFVAAQNDPSAVYGGTIFNVGYGMVQVAIGISVGLYLSALVVYPYGKRRSGLFSF